MKRLFSSFKILLIVIFMTLSVSGQQQGRRSSQGNQPQQPRMILSNQLIKNQQISISMNVFNSTHEIYATKYETIYSPQIQQYIFPLNVQIFEEMDNLTMQVKFDYKDLYTGEFIQAWKGQANLTKFKKITKMNSEQFFATGQMGSMSSNNQKGNFTLHVAQDFNIMIIFSDMSIPGQQKQLFRKLNFAVSQFQFNGKYHQAKYIPRLDISQMHVPYKYYKPISGLLQGNNQTEIVQSNQQTRQNSFEQKQGIKNHTIKIHIYPYDLMKYAVFHQMFDPSQRQQAMKINPLMGYMMDEQALDDMKQLLFTNNLYIVAITMIMTVVKTILEIFALKNEFKVWNEIEKNKGLSIKILYTDMLFQVVFFLYLVDNQSNLMMTLPMAFGILVVVWKIKKTIYIEKMKNFPFVKLRHYDWCKHHQKIDNQGVTYMYYGLGVLFVGYLGYEIVVSSSISAIFSYSGMLQKLVFFMGMAGFIRMTPQLYINYKLKSVDHLPWRTLIYRFIETIIDDFYVFLVTTPFLHKIMVFREDVIFLLYLYQRVIYKTDPNRIGTAGGMVLEKKQFQKVATSINNSSKAQKNQ